MRYCLLLLLALCTLTISGCAIFGGGEEVPAEPSQPYMENTAPAGNVIPNRPFGDSYVAPNKAAIDNTGVIPGRPWDRRRPGNPNENAAAVSRDRSFEMLNYFTANSVKDSRPPWYNRWTESVSDVVEDVNMAYKRLLPPLNPGR